VDTWGQSPLTKAIYHRKHSVEIALLLLGKGAKIDFYAPGGSSALMEAVEVKRIDLVKFLLAHGADPNVKNARGETPLSIALRPGYEKIAVLFKAAGAKR
jgi:ankyrin repeat protein